MYNNNISPRKDGARRLVSVRIDEDVFEEVMRIAKYMDVPFVTALRHVIDAGCNK